MDSGLFVSSSKDSNGGSPPGGMLFETAIGHIHSLLDCDDFEDIATLQVRQTLSSMILYLTEKLGFVG